MDFGVSIAAIHSAQHLGRLVDLWSQRPRRRPGIGGSLAASLAGSLLPLSITAAIGTCCWAVGGAPAVRIVLGAMLALTVPHAAIVAASMDGRRWPPGHRGRHVARAPLPSM